MLLQQKKKVAEPSPQEQLWVIQIMRIIISRAFGYKPKGRRHVALRALGFNTNSSKLLQNSILSQNTVHIYTLRSSIYIKQICSVSTVFIDHKYHGLELRITSITSKTQMSKQKAC